MITSIPLKVAQFCANCEEITIIDEKHGKRTCPICESTAVKPLSSWLNREEDHITQRMPELSELLRLPTPESIRELLHVGKENLREALNGFPDVNSNINHRDCDDTFYE